MSFYRLDVLCALSVVSAAFVCRLQTCCLDAKVELACLSSEHQNTLKEVSVEENKCCYDANVKDSNEWFSLESK